MTRTVLALGLVLVLCIGDGSLHQVLDVALNILPEVEHVGVGPRGADVLLGPAILKARLLLIPVTAGRRLDAVILADVVIHLLAIILDVSQFRLGFVRDVIVFIIF